MKHTLFIMLLISFTLLSAQNALSVNGSNRQNSSIARLRTLCIPILTIPSVLTLAIEISALE